MGQVSIFVKFGESIFGAGGIRPVFLWMFLDTDYSEARLNASDLSLTCQLKMVSNNLAIGVEQQRDRFFFCCVWRGRRIFCEFPLWSGVLRLLLGKIYGNRGLEIIKICAEFWWSHWMCLENSWTRFCIVLNWEILLAELKKSLGGLGENTRDILRQKRKKIRKKGTRKLLKRLEIDRLTVVKCWKNGETFILVWLRAMLSCGGLKCVY